ncbi:MAG: glycogen/starch synthase [Actinomycetota bacterium]|nr:glycogen/starch synthase [Actinomycetota bacterium]
MHVLLATAELSPLIKVGGLADAVAGLRSALLAGRTKVTTVLPDHEGWSLDSEDRTSLDVPEWVGEASARTGLLPDGTPLTLIEVEGFPRSHPYLDPYGVGWSDNTNRYMAFSAAVAALADHLAPDIVHCNDWHTGAVLGFLTDPPPTVLTIHNLAYQGFTDGKWLKRIPHRPESFEWWGGTNPLSGAIALADRVVTVSPSYAEEIRTPEFGQGLDEAIRWRGDAVSGIVNGLDTLQWDPTSDPLIPANFTAADLGGKDDCRAALEKRAGWSGGDPIIGMVTRLTEQKGVDIALQSAVHLEGMGARLVILGSGERILADWAMELAAQMPDRVAFINAYEEPLSHLIFAGSDLLLMPSRFEPCGLNQMQAMRYGTIPVATAVGGLRDTIIDDDMHRRRGTGFLTTTADVGGIVDALHRALRAYRVPSRRLGIQRRGMEIDWSWEASASRYLELYRQLI